MAAWPPARKVARSPRPFHIRRHGKRPRPAAGPDSLLRRALVAAGCLLVIVTPAVALLPGPGGIFTFAAGMTLILRRSPWAKRRYVVFKRRWPRQGAWCDWGLRRASAPRRKARDRAGTGRD